jgi:hypothetical protein
VCRILGHLAPQVNCLGIAYIACLGIAYIACLGIASDNTRLQSCND